MTTVTPGHALSHLLREGTPSLITLVDTCIEDALTLRASDIHIEPRESDVMIRYRIDGQLNNHETLPNALLPELISRIKVLAGLRTDEHQAAQDGRFRHKHPPHDNVDVRVSILPTYYGENAVLRLLTNEHHEHSLTSLGMSHHDSTLVESALSRPHGMILATGPTGSGKTTTLYTLIKTLNTKERSIITIEDPIEYAIPGVTQIQVHTRTALTFANGLRSILRQDPNIIMVGEIRDGETASLAINTALTGHLLLSTVHTNDAATTLPRLIDIGIDAYLVASTVTLVIGQRLVRTLCDACKAPVSLSNSEIEHLNRLGITITETIYGPVGCSCCDSTGYRGRIGIYEILMVTPIIREAILARAPAHKLRELGEAHGMSTMLHDGISKVKTGTTSVAEVLRTITE